MPVSETTVARVLKQAGLPKLWRRSAEARAQGTRPEQAPVADRRALDLRPRRLRTGFGGLFLFAHDLARLDLDAMLKASDMPGSAMIPAGCAFRALLALKLWGVGRPSHVMPETLDRGDRAVRRPQCHAQTRIADRILLPHRPPPPSRVDGPLAPGRPQPRHRARRRTVLRSRLPYHSLSRRRRADPKALCLEAQPPPERHPRLPRARRRRAPVRLGQRQALQGNPERRGLALH